MIVVSEGRSLVGTVTKTFDDYAWVTLITDPKSAVSAIVQESRAEGVVARQLRRFTDMEFVGQGAAVKKGDFVTTSGVGGRLSARDRHRPRRDVQKTDQDLFQKVHVDHLASLSKLEKVLVLTSFEPQSAGEPGMRYWTGAVIAFFLAIVQASSVEQFKVLGVSPNLMLVFLVAWLVVRGLEDVLPMIVRGRRDAGVVGLQIAGVGAAGAAADRGARAFCGRCTSSTATSCWCWCWCWRRRWRTRLSCWRV